MSENLRWKLILGCLVLAAILLPESARVLLQDLQGPWNEDVAARSTRVADAGPGRTFGVSSESPSLKPGRAEGSVALEHFFGRARRDPTRTDPRSVAVLLAR